MYYFLLTAWLALAIQTAPATPTTSSAANAQNPSAAAANPSTPSTKDAAVAPSAPVITIHGLCAGHETANGKSDAACTTVVTRQQFDAVINGLSALGPSLLPTQRRSVAEGYATTLLNYEAAKKAGLERDPRFTEVMRLARMRALGDMYSVFLKEKARKVSPQEIQDYYTSNIANFEELTMCRVILPRRNAANLNDEDYAAKARSLANDIHDRAAKGEDMDKLQKEAFAALGLKDPPTTRMGVVRRGVYAIDQEKQLFALKPGEVTKIVEQPSSFIIFKLEGRETPSLEKSKDEIVRRLVQQHLDKQEQASKNAVQIDYNEQYVGPGQPSARIPVGQPNVTPPKEDLKSSAPKAGPPK